MLIDNQNYGVQGTPEFTPKLLYVRQNESDYSDLYWGEGSGWEWGRWILFVLLGIGILFICLNTIRINWRRSKVGQAPIRGTAWFTPPSYRQSQNQYNSGANQDYVPQYTAEVNEQDLGYYDERGDFHRNDKADYPPLPQKTSEVPNARDADGNPIVAEPATAALRTQENENDTSVFDDDSGSLTRPAYPRPSSPRTVSPLPDDQHNRVGRSAEETAISEGSPTEPREVSRPHKAKLK
ncbi:resistance to Congo red protein KNAG_0J01090 [Huiozyma naganishii CBS 8797]|uniref:Protein RCR2 n=1 Tax=Huiozyma naganishii (strain ATCC MYA-139 / BCRC 22969 / CBS 8797 / KCTC 17520 / NBRC 10181 / NCYC 3082 / Yp74L-3) TaxID=1071383 RepID=J7SAI2_HUIN7|nr:hypothetical protein KNAG_0J01090 [Kazachstania naganishii CBS 8797]CCK72191.1 hypothetical protein KNAG_0J01090 [Kazachstania naganishii CBS 8797]